MRLDQRLDLPKAIRCGTAGALVMGQQDAPILISRQRLDHCQLVVLRGRPTDLVENRSGSGPAVDDTGLFNCISDFRFQSLGQVTLPERTDRVRLSGCQAKTLGYLSKAYLYIKKRLTTEA
jgi:hypothetical protein